MSSGVPDVEEANMVMCAGKMPKWPKVEKGKDYFWCSCGRSKNQPFCDGSHVGTTFTPVKYTATTATKPKMCMCKSTKTPPLCDNTHVKFLCSCFTGASVTTGKLYDKNKY